ncbi:YbjN domain-containing protein [Dialister sp.]|uniref:YbjN domain-containing protein n=1 Tax=Dialister sp. TaxID=1955814 RepID=UPI003F09F339
MSSNTIPFPQGNHKKNLKADIFETYMKKEGLNFFRRQEAHDSYDTVVFMTAIPAGKHHKLVAAVITDNSMYTLLRVHLGTAPKGPARKTFLAFLNDLNAHHAILKYTISEDDNVFLDITTTSRTENFDPEVIRTTLDIVVYQLSQSYDDIARRLDKAGDQTNGFTL